MSRVKTGQSLQIKPGLDCLLQLLLHVRLNYDHRAPPAKFCMPSAINLFIKQKIVLCTYIQSIVAWNSVVLRYALCSQHFEYESNCGHMLPVPRPLIHTPTC